MDIFNKKKIEELEEKIKELEKEIAIKDREISNLAELSNNLENTLGHVHNSLIDIQKDLKHVPEGCKPGRQCAVCEFGKFYNIRHSYGRVRWDDTIYVCGKAEFCQNFVKSMEVE